MTIFNIYSGQLGEQQFGAIAMAIGADTESTVIGSSIIVPILVSAMARNTRTEAGANALSQQLDRAHDGSILLKLPSLYANPSIGQGRELAGQILGDNLADAEALVGQESGLSAVATSKLFDITSPILLGMVGMKKRQDKITAPVLASMLNNFAEMHEREAFGEEEEAPAEAPSNGFLSNLPGIGGLASAIPGLGSLGSLASIGNLGSMLKGGNLAGVGKMVTSLLDKNKDGSIIDDLTGMAGGLMGGRK